MPTPFTMYILNVKVITRDPHVPIPQAPPFKISSHFSPLDHELAAIYIAMVCNCNNTKHGKKKQGPPKD